MPAAMPRNSLVDYLLLVICTYLYFNSSDGGLYSFVLITPKPESKVNIARYGSTISVFLLHLVAKVHRKSYENFRDLCN